MLHIMRHSFSSDEFQRCLQQLTNGQSLLLIESAVYALQDKEAQQALQAVAEQQALYVLSEDLQARGLNAQFAQVVDYAGFVRLTAQYTPSYTW